MFVKTITEYEEEIDRQRRLLGDAQLPGTKIMLNNQTGVSQDIQPLIVKAEIPPEHHELNLSLVQEALEPPHIKEEPEEVWTMPGVQELKGPDILGFQFPPVSVKGEDNEENLQSLPLHQRWDLDHTGTCMTKGPFTSLCVSRLSDSGRLRGFAFAGHLRGFVVAGRQRGFAFAAVVGHQRRFIVTAGTGRHSQGCSPPPPATGWSSASPTLPATGRSSPLPPAARGFSPPPPAARGSSSPASAARGSTASQPPPVTEESSPPPVTGGSWPPSLVTGGSQPPLAARGSSSPSSADRGSTASHPPPVTKGSLPPPSPATTASTSSPLPAASVHDFVSDFCQ